MCYGYIYYCVYKTFINIPFNFVYGLDVILPNEFSLPTLGATQQLEWMNHEHSNKNDELEKWELTLLTNIITTHMLWKNITYILKFTNNLLLR